MHHRTDRISHTTAFVTPVVEHWLEREIASWYMEENTQKHLCVVVCFVLVFLKMGQSMKKSRGALAGTRNNSMGPPHEGSIQRPIAP